VIFLKLMFAFLDGKAQHYVMRLVKSKFMLVLALFAVIGQVTAIPVLACEKMASTPSALDCHSGSQEALDIDFDFDQDASHLHHGSDNLSVSSFDAQDYTEEHNCNLCASCTTATSPSSQALRVPQVAPSEEAVYSAPTISNTLDSLFRPPISA
jgi:hypothetical protein